MLFASMTCVQLLVEHAHARPASVLAMLQVILEAVMNDAEITAIRDGKPLPADSTFLQPPPEGPSRR